MKGNIHRVGPRPAVLHRAVARIPTDWGEFQMFLYEDDREHKEQLALVRGEVAGQDQVLVRVHSESFTGEVLGSRRCDCGEQAGGGSERVNQVNP